MAQQEAAGADLILVNGKVLTMDAAHRAAEALAIRDGKILAVGTNPEIEAQVGSRTEAVDLEGRTALPGLADIHVHLASDARLVTGDRTGKLDSQPRIRTSPAA